MKIVGKKRKQHFDRSTFVFRLFLRHRLEVSYAYARKAIYQVKIPCIYKKNIWRSQIEILFCNWKHEYAIQKILLNKCFHNLWWYDVYHRGIIRLQFQLYIMLCQQIKDVHAFNTCKYYIGNEFWGVRLLQESF